MANRITHERYGDDAVRMNNGLTENFFVVLALSSSALAQTLDEERIALWIARHDQTVRGSGTVSFDLSGATPAHSWDFPWTFGQFVAQKAFLLSVIDDALTGDRWRRGDVYELPDQYVFDSLAKFRLMVKHCREQYLDPETPYELPATAFAPLHSLERCPIHGVFLHELVFPGDHRCIVCNAQFFSDSS